MGCRLRIFLTNEEKVTLSELRKASLVAQRTKDRAFVLLLNARGWKNDQIAEILNWGEKTVRQTIHRWQTKGLVGLWDTLGRGVKPRWQEADLAYLEHALQQEQRTYNSRQLAEKLRRDLRFALLASRSRNSPESRQNQTGTQKKGRVWKRTLDQPPSPAESRRKSCKAC